MWAKIVEEFSKIVIGQIIDLYAFVRGVCIALRPFTFSLYCQLVLALPELYLFEQVATETTSKCIEWLGGVGITKSFLVEKFYRDCKVGEFNYQCLFYW